jgi:hypothetical protein
MIKSITKLYPQPSTPTGRGNLGLEEKSFAEMIAGGFKKREDYLMQEIN